MRYEEPQKTVVTREKRPGHPPAAKTKHLLSRFKVLKKVMLFFSLSIAALLLRVSAVAFSQVAPEISRTIPSFHDDTWHMETSPYLWMAGADGTVSIGNHTVKVEQSFGDILKNLKFGLMGLTEIRRGRVGILTDLMWIRLGDEPTVGVEGFPPGINLKTSLNTFTLTPDLAYRIAGNQRGAIDVFVGGRYYHVGSEITATGGPAPASASYSNSSNWADFVGGARFQVNITSRLGAFLGGDVGGGGSHLTWQIIPGIGYRLGKRWTTQIGYRRLYFNRQPRSAFGLEQTQQGILVGVTFKLK